MGGAPSEPRQDGPDPITELIRQVRERAWKAPLEHNRVVLPDLMPLLHARDAAEGKIAAIGTVNPRPPGIHNAIIQAAKRLIARLLHWHVREQVEFNRAVVQALSATLEALNQTNRLIEHTWNELRQVHHDWRQQLEHFRRELSPRVEVLEQSLRELRQLSPRVEAVEQGLREIEQLAEDQRKHWHQWREGWERKWAESEARMLRGLAELQASFHHRATELEAAYRSQLQAQHSAFEQAMARTALEIQQRLWEDLARVRAEFERLIHYELRSVRQQLALLSPALQTAEAPGAAAAGVTSLPVLVFAEKFRGDEAAIRERQRSLVELFQGHEPVLDLGCGRGEFLELLRQAGIDARGIEQNPSLVAWCKKKGLAVEQGDALSYLGQLPNAALGGAFCSHVVEHLPPEQVPRLIELVAQKMRRDGVFVIETPNPECLVIFATHFYLDPTHTRPVPPALLCFYLQEAGFGNLELQYLEPAVEHFPELAELPASLREKFFGALDYRVIARRL